MKLIKQKNIQPERQRLRFDKHSILGICFLVLCIFSCKKYVEVDPPVTQIVGSVVYNNNISAAAAMSGVYSEMINNLNGFSSGSASLSLEGGLMSDELKNYNSGNITLTQFYTNSLTSIKAGGGSNYYSWQELYTVIHLSDAVIDGLAKSGGVTPALKQQLTGEAKFMRAFLHFYAVNLYGDVPLVVTSDYLTNNSIKRSPKAKVYEQIIQDLKDAQAGLNDNFVDASGASTTERIRPNKGAATALLARAYLYLGDLNHDATMYKGAEDQATKVINNTTNYSLTSDLTQTFLANSTEAIWQLKPVNPVLNTFDAYYFVLLGAPGTDHNPIALSSNLVNSFETDDKRFSNWVGSITSGTDTYYYPFKYKVYLTNQPLSEYLMVLRLAEQYLIRAEARAEQGNVSGAQSDLNTIRTRAGLSNTTANDKGTLLTAIQHERQVEMFSEWGHRWFDLKRTGTVDAVMSVVTPAKGGGAWNPNKALMPLPLGDLQADQNLTQNPGY
jgi:hypothetical protein